MRSQSNSPSEREQRLQAVLVAYLEASERGPEPDPPELLARYPEFAVELSEFFANRAQLDRLAAPLRQLAEAAHAEVAARRTLGAEGNGDVKPGATLRYFGDYELLEEIARGGMGVVFKARQVSLNRLVALKMILKGELATDADVQRFRSEAEAAANLDHPNIVPIYEVGAHEGQQYFSMKLIAGDRLRANGEGTKASRKQQRWAAQVVATIAQAVHYAHQHGILHRDLKPANILMDAQGQPHVTDFGLAKRTASPGADAAEGLTRSGAIVGTASYMAPEQAQSARSLTTAADVYSLGAILYELLTGRPPFQGDDPLAILMKVVNEEPVEPRSLDGAIDRDLQTICLKCLHKDPARRYASAEALAADLERWLAGEPIQARPVSSAERVWRWCRRNPAVASLAAALLLALATGFVGMAGLWLRAADSAADARAEAQRAEQALDDLQEQEHKTRKALDGESRLLYANRLALAQAEWRAHHVDAAAAVLEQAPTDRRGWEWRYLQRLCHAELLTLKSSGFCVAYSPDGKYLATADFDPDARNTPNFNAVTTRTRIKLHDAATGQEVRALVGHSSQVTQLAFSADGKRLASAHCIYGGESSGEAKVWDLETNRQLLSLSCKNGYYAIALSPDGKRLASAEHEAGRRVRIHDVDSGKEVLSLKSDGNVLAFSPDGRQLASGSGNLVEIWDAARGNRVCDCQGLALIAWQVAFSPDGHRLAVAGHSDKYRGAVVLYDARTGQERGAFTNHIDTVQCVAFSPDGKRVASAGKGELKLWTADRGDELVSYPVGAWTTLTSLSFSSDGRRLASVEGNFGDEELVQVWDATSGVECRTLNHGVRYARNLVLSADGRQFLIQEGRGRQIKSWNLTTGEELAVYPFPYRGDSHRQGKFDWLALRGDGTLLALLYRKADDQKTFALEVHDLTAGRLLFTPRPQGIEEYYDSASLTGAAFSPDGRLLALIDGADNTALKVWDTATGQVVCALPRGTFDWKRGNDFSASIRFSPDGSRLLVARQKVVIKQEAHITWFDVAYTLYDVASGKPLRTQRAGSHNLFSPDSRLLALSEVPETVTVWDAISGGERFTFRGAGTAVAFSADSQRLATSRGIWDLSTGTAICTLNLKDNVVGTFSPDGARLATLGDRTVEFWDAATGHHVFTLRGFSKDLHGLMFTPDGDRLLTLDDDTVKIWDATPRKPK